jgi:hypothetical protein
MGNRFKGKTCVHSTVPGSSETADHVVAAEFFPRQKRTAGNGR